MAKLGESDVYIQGAARYAHAFMPSNKDDANSANVEAKVFWRSPDTGLAGLNAGYQSLGLGGFNADYFKAGAQGQLYGSEIVTFSVGAGIFVGGDNTKEAFDGIYAQGGINYYLTDNVAAGIGGTFMAADKNNGEVLSINLKGEYLLPTALPMSMTLGYNYTDVSDIPGSTTHAAMFGFKMYFGSGEGDSLSTIHRSGSADNGNPSVPLLGY